MTTYLVLVRVVIVVLRRHAVATRATVALGVLVGVHHAIVVRSVCLLGSGVFGHAVLLLVVDLVVAGLVVGVVVARITSITGTIGVDLLLRLLLRLGRLLLLHLAKHADALLDEFGNRGRVVDVCGGAVDVQQARQAQNEHLALVLRAELLLQLDHADYDVFCDLLFIQVPEGRARIVHDGGKENLEQMLLQNRLDRKLGLALQSQKHSIENVDEEFIENISTLENLENNLQKDGTFGVISSDRRLSREQSFVCDSEQHLNLVSALHDPLPPVHQVPIQSIEKSVTESILVLLEHKFEAWEHFENYVRESICFANEVLQDYANVVFKRDLCRIYHVLEDWHQCLLVYMPMLLHHILILSCLLNQVEAFLNEHAAIFAGLIVGKLHSDSLRNSCDNLRLLIIDLFSVRLNKILNEVQVLVVLDVVNTLLDHFDHVWK